MKALIEAIQKASNDTLARDAMVYQLWSDGEITLQKGGDLLGKRTLHCIYPPALPSRGIVDMTCREVMPHTNGEGGHGFIYCTGENAQVIRVLMQEAI